MRAPAGYLGNGFIITRLFSGELLLCRVNSKMQFGRCLDHHGALGTSTIGFRSPRLETRTKESNMYASIRERNPSKKNDTVRNESERWDAVLGEKKIPWRAAPSTGLSLGIGFESEHT